MDGIALQIVEMNGQRIELIIHYEHNGIFIYPDSKPVLVTWDQGKECFVLSDQN